jgi:hypothetical protein
MEYTSVGESESDVVVEVKHHSVAMVQQGGIGWQCWAMITGKPLLGTRAV